MVEALNSRTSTVKPAYTIILMVFKCDKMTGMLRRMTENKPGRPRVVNPAKKNKVDLRLPVGLRDRLQECADRDGRSMNAQIVHYIEAGINGIDASALAEAVLEIRAALARRDSA
jgi:predicted DNA-binding protein